MLYRSISVSFIDAFWILHMKCIQASLTRTFSSLFIILPLSIHVFAWLTSSCWIIFTLPWLQIRTLCEKDPVLQSWEPKYRLPFHLKRGEKEETYRYSEKKRGKMDKENAKELSGIKTLHKVLNIMLRHNMFTHATGCLRLQIFT